MDFIKGFFFCLFLFSFLFAQKNEDLLEALNIFVEKPIKDKRDPLIQAIIKKQSKLKESLAMIMRDKSVRQEVRAWTAFIPSIMKQKIGKKLETALIQSLYDPYWRVRLNAVNTLGIAKIYSAIPAILDRLRDNDMYVSKASENVLGKLCNKGHLILLKKKLFVFNGSSQAKILHLIGKIGGKKNIPFLKKVILRLGYNSQKIALFYIMQNNLKFQYLYKIFESSDTHLRENVLQVVQGKDCFFMCKKALKDASLTVRKYAILTLANLKNKEGNALIYAFIKEQLKKNVFSEDVCLAFMVFGEKSKIHSLISQYPINNKKIPLYLKAILTVGLGLHVNTKNNFLQNIPFIKKNKEQNIITPLYRIKGNLPLYKGYEVAVFMEYIYYLYSRLQYCKYGLRQKKIIVSLFKNRVSFQDYVRKNDNKWPFLLDSGAYYSPQRNEIVSYNRYDSSFLSRTLLHETFHQVMLKKIPMCPIWFNEGLAEYYSHFDYQDGIFKLGKPSKRYIKFIQRLFIEGGYTPIEYLFTLDHQGFHVDNFGPYELGNYALSWGILYFMHNAQEKKYKKAFKWYLRNTSSSFSKKSFREALKINNIDFVTFKQNLEAYYLTYE